MAFNGGIINVSLYDSASGKVVVTSTGTYQGTTNTVKILLSPSSFSKFAMYCGNVSAAAKLRTGDTINGPIHFNNKLVTQGGPLFMGKATMGSLQTTSGTPTFLGGYETGVNIPFPDYTSNVAAIKTAASGGGYYQTGGELWLEFSVIAGVASVRSKASSGAAWSAYLPVVTFAPNGTIAINDGALHVSGTVKGTVSLASVVTTGTPPTASVGATYIENNIRYNTDPLITPSSTDLLGLVTAGDITFQQIPIRVDGSVFANQNATLGSGLANTNPAKQIKMVGSFISRNMNSTDFGTGAAKGANFYMKYDTRLESTPPPNFPFPTTNSFEVLSWFE